MARDSVGQTLASVTDEMASGDDKTFTIRLKEPFPLLLAGLAKVSSLPSFITPERVAKTGPFEQVTETIGSGPFKFVTAEFQPGHKAVYVKNADYVPRAEPPSWASDGKVVKVDRFEWLYIPEYSTAAALNDGEVDWWEAPNLDLVPVLAANPAVTVEKTDPLGNTTMLRFNHLYPLFNNVKMRQAVLAVTDQAEFISALAGDRRERGPAGDRRQDPGARLRNSALYTDRAVVAGDCLPEKPQGRHHRPGPVHVERRKDLKQRTTPRVAFFCYARAQECRTTGGTGWLTG
jgi:ABC-type transport system substrate-binding protein